MKKIEFYKRDYVDDGIGGQLVTYNLVYIAYGRVGVLSRQNSYQEYGRIIQDVLEVHLTVPISRAVKGEYYFKVNNLMYEVLDEYEYGRKSVLTGKVMHRDD